MKSYVSYKLIIVYGFCLGFMFCVESPGKETPAKRDYIRKIEGSSDSIPTTLAQRGEVLIAYSDCYTCHARDKRAKGPAFTDIAARYPVNQGYIKLLALRIIQGGSGAWGQPVMTPHPNLSTEEAEIMVTFILSLKKDR